MSVQNFSVKNTISDYILSELKNRPNLSAKDIQQEYSSQLKNCTLQAVYKELSSLVENGFVIKINKKYRLHLGYVNLLLEQADNLNKIYYQSLDEHLLLEDKGRIKYKFKNLYRLNDFWLNTSFSLIKSAKVREYYSWNPYSWFYVFQPNQEKVFLNLLRTKNFVTYKLVSSEKEVKAFILGSLNKERTFISSRRNYFSDQMNTYLTIIDDFIIKVELSQKATDFVSKEVLKGKESNFLYLSKMDYPSWISIERNVKKAQTLKKKFQDFF